MLTQRSIFRLWLPLAASWALMVVEYPIIQGAMARLPEVEIMLAAASLVIGLQITIESPVIMLLATTTALARSPQAYRVLRRFTIHLNVLCTVLAGLVAFVDPLYDVVVRWALGIPEPIAVAAQPAMMIMTFWSAAIGWRRFCQGILIRHGKTRLVGLGTVVRLTCAAVTALVLAFWGGLPGVAVGACSWMAGVVSEAIFSDLAARPTIREHLLGDDDPAAATVDYRTVVDFHAPLAATSLLSLLAMPVIQAGLSRMPFPEENLAAWPVLFAVLLFFRSPGFALPEAVIALLNDASRVRPLRRFSYVIAACCSLGLGAFLLSPLFDFYVLTALDVPPALVPYIVPGLLAGIALPALQALQSWYRGVLMTGNATKHVWWGMGISLVVTTALMVLAVVFEAPGVVSAAAAISIGTLLESVYLGWRAGPVAASL